MAYKTPGVYVEEITTLAPSVAAVETAIPAFIGYTETAIDSAGGSLRFVPTRITSMLEYQTHFGGEFVPATYQVVLDTAAGNAIGAVSPRNAGDTERRYRLFNCVRHYYANGGGPCFIVSAGSYSDAPAVGTASPPSGLAGGLGRVEPVDEPTLLAFPDGVSLTAAEMGSLQVAALAQCAKLQDRFVIMDLCEGDRPFAPAVITAFRDNIGTNNLKYGAAYYPWVRTNYAPEVTFRQLRLVNTANPAVAIPDAAIDGLTGDATLDALPGVARAADTTAGTVVSAVNVSGMTGPGALTLSRRNFAQLTSHFASLLDQLRRLPAAAPAADVQQRFGNLLTLPRALALGLRTIEQVLTLPPALSLAIAGLRLDPVLRAAISGLVAYEKNTGVLAAVSATRTAADVVTDYTPLNGTPWILPNLNVTVIAANTDVFTGANTRDTALNAATALRGFFDPLAAAMLSLFSSAEFLASEAEKQLFARHPVFRDILNKVTQSMADLPPSGAVAGVYAAVDRTRGVWKAPANVSLADVSAVAVKVNDRMQEDLNVTTTGKSVNVIRAFTGKGILIWGARTLAGNDNEWRYVPVRRFFNAAEESIKKATEPFIFEPNDRGTWVRVRAMIENYLTVQWRQGALAGAVTEQAFFVKVGLGETMTSQDILEGRMIVEAGMAVVRPAEFIVLRFAHKMQTS